MFNLEYLITRPGIFKLVTVVFGTVCFILASVSYANSPYTDFYANHKDKGTEKTLPGTELELYHVSITGSLLGLSVTYLILYAFIYELCESSLNRKLDTGFHMIAALFLFASACTSFYAAVEIEDYGCSRFELRPTPKREKSYPLDDEILCHHFSTKIVASVFAILNAVMYCITGITVWTTKDL